jgi:hypothetical protein
MSALSLMRLAGPRRALRSAKMRLWFRAHPIFSGLLGTVLALGAIECILLYYYLNSWVTLPSL